LPSLAGERISSSVHSKRVDAFASVLALPDVATHRRRRYQLSIKFVHHLCTKRSGLFGELERNGL